MLNYHNPKRDFFSALNFCGGFALNAVLVDLGSDTYPIEVYMRIQDYQNKEIIEPKLPNFKCKINVRQ